MTITLSEARQQAIISSVEECIGFRSVEESRDFTLAFLTYLQKKLTGDNFLEFDNFVEVEIFSFGEALEAMLRKVLDNAVNARVFAFQIVPEAYKLKIIEVHKEFKGRPPVEDALLKTLQVVSDRLYVIDEPAVAQEIKSKLDFLAVECKFVDPEEPNVLGKYSPLENKIYLYIGHIFTGMPKAYGDAYQPTTLFTTSISAQCAIVTHVFLHELVHLFERCAPENELVNVEVLRESQKEMNQWAKLKRLKGMNLSDADMARMMPILGIDPNQNIESLEKIFRARGRASGSAYSHCTRFKLALLELSTQPDSNGFVAVRPQFKQNIIDRIFQDESLTPEMDVYLPFVYDQQGTSDIFSYDWESMIHAETSSLIDDDTFVPKSEVVETIELTVSLKKAGDRVKRKNPSVDFGYYTETAPAYDLFYTVDGESNLLSMGFEGDAFSQLSLVLSHMTLTPSSEIRIRGGEPFLGMYLNGDVVMYTYSHNGREFTDVTLEEVWWLLTL